MGNVSTIELAGAGASNPCCGGDSSEDNAAARRALFLADVRGPDN